MKKFRPGIKFAEKEDPLDSKISKWQTLQNRLKSGTLLGSSGGSITRPIRRGTSGSPLGSVTGAGQRRSSKFSSGSILQGVGNFNAKLLILEAKSHFDAAKKKHKERSERRRLLQKQLKLETQLEYLNFPTIMGWYFDGFFTPHFQLNEEYAVIFNELEKEVAQKKEAEYKETFTEKVKRNFWPPKLIGKWIFRTKGVYLDFKEILKDPPHTPPDIVTDPRTKAVTLFINDEGLDDTDSKVASVESIPRSNVKITMSEYEAQLLSPYSSHEELNTIFPEQIGEEKKSKHIHKDAFYFDDTIPGFFRKTAANKHRYYFDTQFSVWRIKRIPVLFPNDFYFDERRGLFLAKDRTNPRNTYMYYPEDGCYHEAGETGPANWRGLTSKSFYWDEQKSKWIRVTKAPRGARITLDLNANRYCLKNPKAKTPDDYYFDTATKTFVLKEIRMPKDYHYDPAFGAWRKKTDPDPQKASINPNDYYWNDVEHNFIKKDAPSAFFVYDPNNRFFRKKKSVRGIYHPKNWNWNEKKKLWEPKKTKQSRFFTESLYWRPDRDYDKPWLEYAGGFRKYGQKNFRHSLDYEEEEKHRITSSASEPIKISKVPYGQKYKTTSNDPMPVHQDPETTTSKMDSTTVRHQVVDIKTTSKTDNTAEKNELLEGRKRKSIADALRNAALYDTKVLKCRNLGLVVTDGDIKAYFASVKKVIRPNIPGTTRTEDYAYLFFHTEEAAEAALRTMHNRVIKGQTISLQYKLKDEDPHKGQ